MASKVERLLALRAQVADWVTMLPKVAKELQSLRGELDMARSAADLPKDSIEHFLSARQSAEYTSVYEQERPLVSVCVGTYNRSKLLVERCLRSLLAQSYDNLEIIVVGDCCTDDTERAVARLRDSRVAFVNLPQRGPYPSDPRLRWMVAGTMPVNHALTLATGTFITHLDDDDEHAVDRIEKLLAHIRQTKADLTYHPFHWEVRPGVWRINEARDFRYTQVTTSSVFYHHWLKAIPWDAQAYRYREPGDWNRFRKLNYLGVTATRFPEPLLRHYKERTQQVSS